MNTFIKLLPKPKCALNLHLFSQKRCKKIIKLVSFLGTLVVMLLTKIVQNCTIRKFNSSTNFFTENAHKICTKKVQIWCKKLAFNTTLFKCVFNLSEEKWEVPKFDNNKRSVYIIRLSFLSIQKLSYLSVYPIYISTLISIYLFSYIYQSTLLSI